MRTLAALAQVPLVLVRVKLIVSDECEKPSKLLIVRLKLPNPSSLPAPALVKGPGENPVPAFVPTILLVENVVAFTLRATLPPSPNRYIFPATVFELNVTVAVVLFTKVMVTVP